MKSLNILIIVIFQVLIFTACQDPQLVELNDAIKKKSIRAIIEFKLEYPESEYIEQADKEIKKITKWIDNQEYGVLIDERDGKKYKTILMRDENIWMAQNLNYYSDEFKVGSWCAFNKEKYCEEFGRLYNWENAKKACPKGWHLPSDDEWWNLVGKYGGANQSWLNYDGEGRRDETDGREAYWKLRKDTKFQAELGGWRRKKVLRDGFVFDDLGKYGKYWTSTRIPESEIIYFHFSGSSGIERLQQNSIRPKDYWGFSCRCVKNKK